MEIKIEQEESVSKGRFYVEDNEKTLAEMTYSIAGPDKIIIDHTDVDESLRGRRVGFKLFEAAVNYARDSNKKVLPLCPFAKAQFEKYIEYNDVLLS
jgi:predicted GNAT family acetyltransferase